MSMDRGINPQDATELFTWRYKEARRAPRFVKNAIWSGRRAMQHSDFLRARFGGKNWVLARRTPNIVRRYGEDVICVSKQRYAQIEKEYRALYGDPYDATRAKMYLALLAALEELAGWVDTSSQRAPQEGPDSDTLGVIRQIDEALAAERNAR